MPIFIFSLISIFCLTHSTINNIILYKKRYGILKRLNAVNIKKKKILTNEIFLKWCFSQKN